MKKEQFLKERQENADRITADLGAVKSVSTFRRALPQILATTAKNLLFINIGMTMSFGPILLPLLTTSKTGLHFTSDQASWFGSIGYLFLPLGNLSSGILLEPIGRKYALMVVNIPNLIGWYLFYIAESLSTVYAATILLWFGIGFTEAPTLTYVAEISEPQFRGRLMSYSYIFVIFGSFLTYSFGNFTNWKNIAFCYCFLPIATIIILTLVPESPLWLSSKGRYLEAERSLCWLRGWVEPRAVLKELKEVINYTQYDQKTKNTSDSHSNQVEVENKGLGESKTQHNRDLTKTTTAEQDSKQFTNHKNSSLRTTQDFKNKEEPSVITLREILRPEMLRPFGFVVAYHIFLESSTLTPLRPYQLTVLRDLNIPIDPKQFMVILSVVQFVGLVLCMISVPWFGKKPIALFSTLVCSISAIITGLYVFWDGAYQGNGWLPFITVMLIKFFGAYTISTYSLISEVFPNRGRSLATGVSAAIFSVIAFTCTKSYTSLEAGLGLGGVFLLLGGISAVGVVFIYYGMLETEGLSLEQIEQHYKTSGRSSE